MRAFAAIAAIVVEAPIRSAPVWPMAIPVVSAVGTISTSGPRETPLRRRSERSVPAARNSALSALGVICVSAVMPRSSG